MLKSGVWGKGVQSEDASGRTTVAATASSTGNAGGGRATLVRSGRSGPLPGPHARLKVAMLLTSLGGGARTTTPVGTEEVATPLLRDVLQTERVSPTPWPISDCGTFEAPRSIASIAAWQMVGGFSGRSTRSGPNLAYKYRKPSRATDCSTAWTRPTTSAYVSAATSGSTSSKRSSGHFVKGRNE